MDGPDHGAPAAGPTPPRAGQWGSLGTEGLVLAPHACDGAAFAGGCLLTQEQMTPALGPASGALPLPSADHGCPLRMTDLRLGEEGTGRAEPGPLLGLPPCHQRTCSQGPAGLQPSLSLPPESFPRTKVPPGNASCSPDLCRAGTLCRGGGCEPDRLSPPGFWGEGGGGQERSGALSPERVSSSPSQGERGPWASQI